MAMSDNERLILEALESLYALIRSRIDAGHRDKADAMAAKVRAVLDADKPGKDGAKAGASLKEGEAYTLSPVPPHATASSPTAGGATKVSDAKR